MEYKKAMKEDQKLRVILRAVLSFGLFVALVLSVPTLFWVFNKKVFPFAVIILLVVLVISSVIITNFLTRKIVKNNESLDVSTSILDKFRTAVYGIVSTDYMRDNYTVNMIYDILVYHAVRVLDSERQFDEVRMQKGRQTEQILRYGNFLGGCQRQLQSVLVFAWESFGLNFKKDMLFEVAKLRIEYSRPKV